MTGHWTRRRADSQGFTLVELLISITLVTIVIALSTGLIIKALDHNSNLTQQSEAQNRNNTGMEQLTRALRQAVFPRNGTNTNSSIITIAEGKRLQFTTRLVNNETAFVNQNTWNTSTSVVQVMAKLDTTKHQLQWGLGAQNTCTDPTVCTYATPPMTRVLTSGVRNDQLSSVCPKNTGDGNVFHYWYVDPSGNLAAWNPANPLAPTQAELAKISVVQIDLWTQTQTGPQKPACVALSDYVQLRNWR